MQNHKTLSTSLAAYLWRYLSAVFGNIVLMLLVYFVLRFIFIFYNFDYLRENLDCSQLWNILRGGELFDIMGVSYTNALYLLLALIPLRKAGAAWNRVCRWAWFVPNAVGVIGTLCDTVFFPFQQQRVTARVFDEFGKEANLGSVIWEASLTNWYMWLIAAVILWIMWWGYRDVCPSSAGVKKKSFYISRSILMVTSLFLLTCGTRGQHVWKFLTRPVTVTEAAGFVSNPRHASAVLNTPFCVLRTIGKAKHKVENFYATQEDLDAVYNPVHVPDTATFRKKNVVVILLESFSKEFIGALNPGKGYTSYTPFLDSLAGVSLTWENTFSNTRKSVDGCPAILASIPRMEEPYVTSAFSQNNLMSLPSVLRDNGYKTAFFLGAVPESLGIRAFTQSIGVGEYYSMDDYIADKRFGGKADYDGSWGIFDEEFLQYAATMMGQQQQPFFGGIFTLTSHHPYPIPERYKERFNDAGPLPGIRAVRYTDMALQRFFHTASQQPWYKNTIFVITADHADPHHIHPEEGTDLAAFNVPILFFDPSGQMPRGMRPGVAQQIDIMPTMLNYLGTRQPYIAFGKDLLATKGQQDWAFNWTLFPQYIQGPFVLQTDAHGTPRALYNYIQDPMLQTDLKEQSKAKTDSMTARTKAIIQSYWSRMYKDQLTVESKN